MLVFSVRTGEYLFNSVELMHKLGCKECGGKPAVLSSKIQYVSNTDNIPYAMNFHFVWHIKKSLLKTLMTLCWSRLSFDSLFAILREGCLFLRVIPSLPEFSSVSFIFHSKDTFNWTLLCLQLVNQLFSCCLMQLYIWDANRTWIARKLLVCVVTRAKQISERRHWDLMV